MDLQSIKTHYGPKWAWARTGALILFLVTGILLVASLTMARSWQRIVALRNQPILNGRLSPPLRLCTLPRKA